MAFSGLNKLGRNIGRTFRRDSRIVGSGLRTISNVVSKGTGIAKVIEKGVGVGLQIGEFGAIATGNLELLPILLAGEKLNDRAKKLTNQIERSNSLANRIVNSSTGVVNALGVRNAKGLVSNSKDFIDTVNDAKSINPLKR